MMNKIVALDADGVMLDFDAAYVNLWEKVFGYRPKEIEPNAYWAFDRYDIPYLEGEELQEFKKNFDEEFWLNVPALPGAVECTHRLHEAGYRVICVSALPVEYKSTRLACLRKQDFIVENVIAVGAPVNAAKSHGNPKADYLNILQPDVFVDDYLAYHEGVKSPITRVLIDRNPIKSPNRDPELQARVEVDKVFNNLVEFTDAFIGER